MDYKEKYNKLVEAVKVLQEENPSDEGIQNWASDNVPELRESKDEKMRKEIVGYLKMNLRYEWATWLEKQGQKSVVIIPKFRVGDEIVTPNEESLTITKIDEKGYWSGDLFICDFDEECIWDLVEQKPAWTEADDEELENTINALKGAGKHGSFDWLSTVKWLLTIKQRIGGYLSCLHNDNKECRYCHSVTTQGGWRFKGCFCPPLKGMSIVEVKVCPKAKGE